MRLGVCLLACTLWSGERCNANNENTTWYKNNSDFLTVYYSFWPSTAGGISAANNIMVDANCSGTPTPVACIFTHYTALSTAYAKMHQLGQALTALGWGWNPPIPTPPKPDSINSTCAFSFTDLLASLTSGTSNYGALQSNILALNTLVNIYPNITGKSLAIPPAMPITAELGDKAIAYGKEAAKIRTLYADIVKGLPTHSQLETLYTITGSNLSVPVLPTSPSDFSAANLQALITAWSNIQAVYTTFFSTLQSAQAATKDIPFLAVSPPVTTGSITNQIRDNLFRWNRLQDRFQKKELPKLIADLETLSTRIGIPNRDVPPAPATLVSQKDFTAIGDTWRSVQALYATDVSQLKWLAPALQKLSAAMGDEIIAINLPEGESKASPENVTLMLTASETLQSAYDRILSQLEGLYAIPSAANPAITALQKFCLDANLPLVNPPNSNTLSPINVVALGNAWGSMTKVYETAYNLLNPLWTPIQQLYPVISGEDFPSIPLPETTPSEFNIKALDKAWETAQFAYSSILELHTQVRALISSMSFLYTGGEIPSVSEEFNLSNIMSLGNAWTNAKAWHEQYVKNLSSIHPTGKVLDDLQNLQRWVTKATEINLKPKQIQNCLLTQGTKPGCPTL